jgi:hypothetical protein
MIISAPFSGLPCGSAEDARIPSALPLSQAGKAHPFRSYSPHLDSGVIKKFDEISMVRGSLKQGLFRLKKPNLLLAESQL